MLAPLPIGFAVFMVHLATIPVTGTGINPARSFGAAVIYNKDKIWDDHVIFLSTCPFIVYKENERAYFYKYVYVYVLVAVDILGWTSNWSCSGCNLPPTHSEGYSHKSSWLFQEQCLIKPNLKVYNNGVSPEYTMAV